MIQFINSLSLPEKEILFRVVFYTIVMIGIVVVFISYLRSYDELFPYN